MSTKASMDNAEIKNNIFDPRRQIPTLSYTLQNILMSMATIMCSTSSLLFTISVVLPLSMLRTLAPRKWLRPSGVAALADRNKVVLIIGASKGIGNNIMKQYAHDPDTVIIAVSKKIEATRKAVIELGDKTTAIVQCAEVDLTAPRKQLVESIRSLDKQYGPITHLYEVSGISNHLKDSAAWGLESTAEMIQVNVSGTVTSVLTMYELMKSRGYGKICIVGSVAGIYAPANMISYAATKSFVNTFSTSLRVLGAPCGVDVVTVQPGFIDTQMTKQMRGQGSTVPGAEFASAGRLARHVKRAVERGGVGVVSWPLRQSVVMYGLKALNPICEELGRWVSMKMGLSGKKIT